MKRPTRADLATAICIYLQTVLVAPALTVVVAENGRVTVESESAHLAKWHAESPHAAGRSAEIRAADPPEADVSSGHQHFRFAETSSARSDPAFSAVVPIVPGPPPAAIVRDHGDRSRARVRRREPPPDAASAASDADFAAVKLTI